VGARDDDDDDDDDDELAADAVYCSYIDQMMLLLSHNVSSLIDDQFAFSGENFFSAAMTAPLQGDFQQRTAADADSDAAFVQFNISSTSSGNQQ